MNIHYNFTLIFKQGMCVHHLYLESVRHVRIATTPQQQHQHHSRQVIYPQQSHHNSHSTATPHFPETTLPEMILSPK